MGKSAAGNKRATDLIDSVRRQITMDGSKDDSGERIDLTMLLGEGSVSLFIDLTMLLGEGSVSFMTCCVCLSPLKLTM